MIDINLYATIAAKLLGGEQEDPKMIFASVFYNHRKEVVRLIAEKYTYFSPMSTLVDSSTTVEQVNEEFNIMQKFFLEDPNLKNDIYFAVLIAAQGAVLCINSENHNDLLEILIENVMNINQEPIGGASIFLLVVALWIINYQDFRSKVNQIHNDLKKQGEFQ